MWGKYYLTIIKGLRFRRYFPSDLWYVYMMVPDILEIFPLWFVRYYLPDSSCRLEILECLREIIYLTVPVDLRFLRYFSGTDASSWHSFSAHSLNPRPELSPPATCHRLKRGRFRCLGSHSIHKMPCNISRLRSQFLIFSNVSSLT